MSCDIIIPVWNQLELTKSCIEHIAKNTSYSYRLIIIDNGSDEDTRQYLRQLSLENKQLLLIRNETNLGYVLAINQGLEASIADYACLFNNDVFVARGWLTEMIGVCESADGIGVVNPESDEIDSDSIDEKLQAKSVSLICLQGQFIEITGAMGFCMLLKRELIAKVGFLDDIFGLGGYDDMDYSRRAHVAGYKCVKAKAAYVIHRVHSSFDKLGAKQKKRIGKQTRSLFWQKWGQISRIAFVISKPFNEEISALAYELARNWNMVRFFLKESTEKPLFQHQAISSVKYPDSYFLWCCLGQIFKPRKRRVSFKQVFVDDKKLFYLLRIFRFIHGAKVVLISENV